MTTISPTTKIALWVVFLAFISGCSHYVTPGGPANLSAITQSGDSEAHLFSKEQKRPHTGAILKKTSAPLPAVKFPASLVVARVQERGYRSYYFTSTDFGELSLVTARTGEDDQSLGEVRKLKGLNELGTLNRILLKSSSTDTSALREAASQMHADLLLLYTFSESVRDQDKLPLFTVLTLGFAPTMRYEVTSTVSAALLDVKTGYVYGTLENSSSHKGLTIGWNIESAISSASRKVERDAFKKLVKELSSFWDRFYERYHTR